MAVGTAGRSGFFARDDGDPGLKHIMTEPWVLSRVEQVHPIGKVIGRTTL
jgi:hypothetical protein